MTDDKETDYLAYILACFIIGISGIAVGVASTNPTRESAGDNSSRPAAAAPPRTTLAASEQPTIPSRVGPRLGPVYH